MHKFTRLFVNLQFVENIIHLYKYKETMKKGCIGLIVLGVIALALFGWVKNGYNGLVKQQESVETAWAQVENQYQRRADLIPNLVETVKGYAKHEQDIFLFGMIVILQVASPRSNS